MSDVAIALLGSSALGAVHWLTPYLVLLPVRYRAVLASFSGGAGLSYVFLYLLYELSTEGAPEIHRLLPLGPEPLETLFILLLLAVAATHLVVLRFEKTVDPRDDHMGFGSLFVIYNLLAGAGVREEANWGSLNLAFYVAAIGLHLLFNERFLLHLCPAAHTRRWRISLAAAPVIGCLLAIATDPPKGLLYGILTLVAGGTIITVIRRELPDLRTFSSLGFVSGLVAYATVIFAFWRF